jgi:copper homeostasis protein
VSDEPAAASAGITVEVCADSIAGAAAAEGAGAHRLELCANLLEGGTTPGADAIELARERMRIPIRVMIRPRPGGFTCSAAELEVMARDIEAAKRLGAAGVVVGALTEDGAVDTAAMRRLIERARPLAVTFHRAFDEARDPLDALERIIDLGADRLLTSGQERSAEDGIPLIRRLVERAGGRIVILPGSGVTAANAARIVRETGAREIHASCRGPGGATDPERVSALVRAVEGL